MLLCKRVKRSLTTLNARQYSDAVRSAVCESRQGSGADALSNGLWVCRGAHQGNALCGLRACGAVLLLRSQGGRRGHRAEHGLARRGLGSLGTHCWALAMSLSELNLPAAQ